MFRESNCTIGKPNETEDAPRTHQDREAVATACIWLGKPELGRGSEVSLVKAEGMTIKESMIQFAGTTFSQSNSNAKNQAHATSCPSAHTETGVGRREG